MADKVFHDSHTHMRSDLRQVLHDAELIKMMFKKKTHTDGHSKLQSKNQENDDFDGEIDLDDLSDPDECISEQND